VKQKMLILGVLSASVLSGTAGAAAQERPFTQDQVQGLVRSGLGDDSGAKLIKERGIDFAPAEDFLQSLKAAGASEAFLKVPRGQAARARKLSNKLLDAWLLIVRWSPQQSVN
jgi:hypothetical protein